MRIQKTETEKKQERLLKLWSKGGIRKINGRWIVGKPKRKRKKNKNKKKKEFLVPPVSHLKGKSYEEFLSSDYWNYVRKLVLRRDKYECVICGNKKDLHVHHDTYKHHFNEHKHLEDLLTLCGDCHTEHHYCTD